MQTGSAKSFFARNINVIMFITLSLSWGFSWFCGKYQVNNIIYPEIAGMYRFILAALILLAIYVPLKRPRLIPNLSELKIVAVYSVFSFCMNFIIFYYAIFKMVTGFNAIMFSFSIVFSHIIGKFVFKIDKKFDWRFYTSLIIGISGLFLVLLPKFTNLKVSIDLFIGLFLCVLATMSFSFGSTFYESKSAAVKADPIVVFIWCLIGGAFYALCFGFLHSIFAGQPLVLLANFTPQFVLSLLYLAGPATALGYLCCMLLIKNIGSVKTNYTSLVSPTIAMLVTSVFEDYKFTMATFIGILLISLSKVVMFYRQGNGKK